MEANARNAYVLFNGKSRYLIPVFQRRYVWEQKKQWAPLWADVEELANAILEAPETSDAQHFLGAIVLQNKSLVPGDSVPWLVIDGQQRLLTLQLLLDASEREYRDQGADLARDAQRFRRLVQNNDEDVDPGDPDTVFKVWPTFSDQGAFRTAMSKQESTISWQDSPIVQAHEFFRQQVRGWLARDPENLVSRAEALSTALRERLMVVAIGLGGKDNPNLIFETLNARGTPLLAWDLIKNELMHRASQAIESPEALYAEFIGPLEQDDWWRTDVRQGSLFVPRIEAFLFHWLTLRTNSNVPADGVFGALKAYLKGRSHRDVARDLSVVATQYKLLETITDHTPLGRFLHRWRAMEIRVLTPHLLWLLLNHVDGEKLQRSLAAFESFFVRRVVCRLNSPGLNRTLLGLLRDLAEHGPDNADKTIETFLVSLSAERLIWPDDDLFRKHLVDEPIYLHLKRQRTLMIIEALNAKLQDDVAAVLVDNQELFIEHIMPQKWQLHYQMSPPPATDEDERIARREHLIHTLGNLSLTTSKVGRQMSHDSWLVKRAYLKQAGLALNSDLVEHAPSDWDDAAIVARGERLADIALEIWPRPEQRFRLL